MVRGWAGVRRLDRRCQSAARVRNPSLGDPPRLDDPGRAGRTRLRTRMERSTAQDRQSGRDLASPDSGRGHLSVGRQRGTLRPHPARQRERALLRRPSGRHHGHGRQPHRWRRGRGLRPRESARVVPSANHGHDQPRLSVPHLGHVGGRARRPHRCAARLPGARQRRQGRSSACVHGVRAEGGLAERALHGNRVLARWWTERKPLGLGSRVVPLRQRRSDACSCRATES
jgi:hypothetical protein